jgi:hypothetical protein
MFSYSTGYYVSPPVDQYLKFKNRCSLLSIEYVDAKANDCSVKTQFHSVKQGLRLPVNLIRYDILIFNHVFWVPG